MNRYKNNTKKKFAIEKVNFFSGVLFFFKLGENPYSESLKKILNRTDYEALYWDLQSVGTDFQKVIGSL